MSLYDEAYTKLKQQGFTEDEISQVLKNRESEESEKQKQEKLQEQCIKILKQWLES